jgi:phosphoketolase
VKSGCFLLQYEHRFTSCETFSYCERSSHERSDAVHPRVLPAFCEGIQYFADSFPEIDRLGAAPLLGPNQPALPDATSEAAIYQTLLAADALRYLTLQVTGSKSSGHPGGFASSADAVAALHLLGHRNMVTEVGHHAPGFYSAMFLDTSLEDMGIHTVSDMRARFRERHGLLGHLSGAIPGLWRPRVPWARASISPWPAPI